MTGVGDTLGQDRSMGQGRPVAGSRSPMECSETLLRVFEYLDGEIGDADHAQIRAHLDECAECLRQYRLDEMVKLVVKRSCAAEPAPLRLRQTILAQLTVIRVETAD